MVAVVALMPKKLEPYTEIETWGEHDLREVDVRDGDIPQAWDVLHGPAIAAEIAGGDREVKGIG